MMRGTDAGVESGFGVWKFLSFVDPSGIADGLNALLYAVNGEWAYATTSAVAMAPYIGDLAKSLRIAAKADKATGTATDVVRAAQRITAGDESWKLIAAHAEPATGKAFRNGVSIQETFEHVDTGEQVTRHMIVRNDRVLHGPHYRRYAD